MNKTIFILIIFLSSTSIFAGDIFVDQYFNANKYYNEGNFSQTIRILNELENENLNYKDIFLLRGYAYLKEKKYDEAEKDFIKLISFDSSDITAIDGIYEISFLTDKNILQDKVLHRLLPAPINNDQQEYEKHYKNGLSELKSKNYLNAIHEFNLAVSFKNDEINLYLAKSICFKEINDYNNAILTNYIILGLSNNNINALINIGQIYAEQKKYIKAEKYFNFILQISKDNNIAQKALLELEKKKHSKSGIDFYQEGIKFIQEMNLEKALTSFESAINTNKYFLPSYNEIGNIYIKQNKFEDALVIFKKALEHDKKYIPSYIGIATVYEIQKKYNKAIKVLNTALQIDSIDISVNNKLKELTDEKNKIIKLISTGDLLLKNGCLNEALENYMHIYNMLPNFNPVLIKIGEIYLDKNELSKAKEFFGKVLKNDNSNIPALLGYAKIYDKQKNRKTAYKYFKMVSKLDERNITAYKYLNKKKTLKNIKDIRNSIRLTRSELAALLIDKLELDIILPVVNKRIILIDIEDYWEKDYIKKAVAIDIMESFPNKMFLPGRIISKGELAEYLINIYNKLAKDSFKYKNLSKAAVSSPYIDIPPLHENFNAIIICSLEGILNGTLDNTFQANDIVSGEDAFIILDRFNKFLKTSNSNI